MTTATPNT